MVDPNSPASVRVRAAESILSHSAKAIEIEGIEARVAELERVAEETSENAHIPSLICLRCVWFDLLKVDGEPNPTPLQRTDLYFVPVRAVGFCFRLV